MITTSKFENISDSSTDKLATIESLAVEFEQRLHAVMHPEASGHPSRAVPSSAVPERGVRPAGGRTEALINRGRPGYRRSRRRRLLAHWRLIAAGLVTLNPSSMYPSPL